MRRSLPSFALHLGGVACVALMLTGCAQGSVIFANGGTAGSSVGDTDSGGSSGTGGVAGAGGGHAGATATGGMGPCMTAEDCVSFSDACNVGACINGACGKLPAADGAPCE